MRGSFARYVQPLMVLDLRRVSAPLLLCSYRVFPAAVDPKDRRRHTVPLLRPRPTSVLVASGHAPRVDLELSQAWRLLASAVP
jgi:hypothetical protein